MVHIALGQVVYGNLIKTGGVEAAVNIWCDNGGGTADGQLANSWVIFSGATGTLAVVARLVPQQPSDATGHVHVPFFDTGPGGIAIQPGKITTKELWYGPNDGTCCPSIRATTVWGYSNGALLPITTTHS